MMTTLDQQAAQYYQTQRFGQQKQDYWAVQNLNMDSANASNNELIQFAEGIENLKGTTEALKAWTKNKQTKALYQQRMEKLRSDTKLKRLTPDRLSEAFKDDEKYRKRVKESYKSQVTALSNGYNYNLSEYLNTEKSGFLRRQELTKYTNTQLQGLESYINGVFTSGIPLEYEDGRIVNLGKPDLDENTLADVINTLSHEYFESKGFFDEDGKGGPTDEFLLSIGFTDKLDAVELAVLNDRRQLASEFSKQKTLNAVSDEILQTMDNHFASVINKGPGEDLDLDMLVSMLMTTDGKAGKTKTYGEAWDHLFKLAKEFHGNGMIREATYLLDQLEESPHVGKGRVEKAKAALYEDSNKARNKWQEAINSTGNLLSDLYRDNKITEAQLQALDGEVDPELNPRGVPVNWEGITAAKWNDDQGDPQLIIEALERGTLTINPADKKYYPSSTWDAIDEADKVNGTYESRKHGVNKEAWENDRNQIRARIGKMIPNWQNDQIMGPKMDKMREAAFNDYEALTRAFLMTDDPKMTVQIAMDKAQNIVLKRLEGAIDEKTAKKNIYYTLGNAGYDRHDLSNMANIGSFTKLHFANLTSDEGLANIKADANLEEIKDSWLRIPELERANLIHWSKGSPNATLPPRFENLYQHTLTAGNPLQQVMFNGIGFHKKQVFKRLLTILEEDTSQIDTNELDKATETINKLIKDGDPLAIQYGNAYLKLCKNPTSRAVLNNCLERSRNLLAAHQALQLLE